MPCLAFDNVHRIVTTGDSETYIMHGNLAKITNKQKTKQQSNSSSHLKLTLLSLVINKTGTAKIIERKDMTLQS